jgi:hypothetical protein
MLELVGSAALLALAVLTAGRASWVLALVSVAAAGFLAGRWSVLAVLALLGMLLVLGVANGHDTSDGEDQSGLIALVFGAGLVIATAVFGLGIFVRRHFDRSRHPGGS